MTERGREFSIEVEVPKELALDRLKKAMDQILEYFGEPEEMGDRVLNMLTEKLPDKVNPDGLASIVKEMQLTATRNKSPEAGLLFNLFGMVKRGEVLG